MRVVELVPELMVEDVGRAVEFYVDVFGFEVECQWDSFAKIKMGSVAMSFYRRKEFEDEVERLKGVGIGGSMTLYIKVDDVDVVWDRVRSMDGGVSVLRELRKMEYGGREFVFEDVCGYIIIVSGD